MRLVLLAAILALLVGCGSDRGPSGAPRYDLTVTFWPQGKAGESRTATLTCDPDGGTHSNPAAACDALLQHEDALRSVSGDMACTEIYGGPQLATISGGGVHALLSRTNGCEISRWEALAPVVELAR